MEIFEESSAFLPDEEPHLRRCASPLPRVEAFYRHRPASSRPLRSTSNLIEEHRILPSPPPSPQRKVQMKPPMSPVSSISVTRPLSPTPGILLKQPLFFPPYGPKSSPEPPKQLSKSPPLSAVSSISSSNDSSTIVASFQSVDSRRSMNTVLRPVEVQLEPVEPPKISQSTKPSGKTTAVDLSEVFQISRTAAERHCRPGHDIFDEDDFTDCFNSSSFDIDIDTALDEYLVLSRRYDSGIKMRREVRNALPKKNIIGGALWERIYSDLSSHLNSGRSDRRTSQLHMSASAEGEEVFTPEAMEADGRAVVSKEAPSKNTNQMKSADSETHSSVDDLRTIDTAQSVTRLLSNDFLKFHGLKRAVQRQKKPRRFFASCKKFFKSILSQKSQPFPDEDDQEPPWTNGKWDHARIA